MAALSFKKVWIEPILSGEKTDTIRARLPAFKTGDIVAATCRYGDPPFARLRIDGIGRVLWAQLDEPRRVRLRKAYPDAGVLWRVAFTVVS